MENENVSLVESEEIVDEILETDFFLALAALGDFGGS